MGLKVYVFFNVRTSEPGEVYLENQRSHFYEIKSKQSEAVRNEGVIAGILPDEELYHIPEPVTTTQRTMNTTIQESELGSDNEELQIPSSANHDCTPTTSKSPMSFKMKKILDVSPRKSTPKQAETTNIEQPANHQDRIKETSEERKREVINHAYRKQAYRENPPKRGRPSKK